MQQWLYWQDVAQYMASVYENCRLENSYIMIGSRGIPHGFCTNAWGSEWNQSFSYTNEGGGSDGGTGRGVSSHGGGNAPSDGSKGSGNNGIPLTDKVKQEIRSHFTMCYDNDENVPNGMDDKYFEELFDGLGSEISQETYDFLTGTEHKVDFFSEQGWMDYENNREFNGDVSSGLAFTLNHTMTFQESTFTDPDFNFGGFSIIDSKSYWMPIPVKYDLPDYIFHELGHSWGNYKNGEDYYDWNWRYQENWAIDFNNIRRERLQLPIQPLNSTWWPFWHGNNP